MASPLQGGLKGRQWLRLEVSEPECGSSREHPRGVQCVCVCRGSDLGPGLRQLAEHGAVAAALCRLQPPDLQPCVQPVVLRYLAQLSPGVVLGGGFSPASSEGDGRTSCVTLLHH